MKYDVKEVHGEKPALTSVSDVDSSISSKAKTAELAIRLSHGIGQILSGVKPTNFVIEPDLIVLQEGVLVIVKNPGELAQVPIKKCDVLSELLVVNGTCHIGEMRRLLLLKVGHVKREIRGLGKGKPLFNYVITLVEHDEVVLPVFCEESIQVRILAPAGSLLGEVELLEVPFSGS